MKMHNLDRLFFMPFHEVYLLDMKFIYSGVTVELTWLLFLNILPFNFFPTSNKSLRFRRFRRSYVNCYIVVPTSHCHGCTALPFLLDERC